MALLELLSAAARQIYPGGGVAAAGVAFGAPVMLSQQQLSAADLLTAECSLQTGMLVIGSQSSGGPQCVHLQASLAAQSVSLASPPCQHEKLQPPSLLQ